MKTISKYDDIVKTLYSELQVQSELKKDRIINALSVRGPELSKIINKSSTTINLSDSFITFEVIEDPNGTSMGTTEEDGSLTSIATYQCILHIYGNDSPTLAQKIQVRFKSEAVVTKLREEGVRLIGISSPDSVNEFINNTMVPRRDLILYVEVQYNISPISDDGYAESIKDLNVDLLKF